MSSCCQLLESSSTTSFVVQHQLQDANCDGARRSLIRAALGRRCRQLPERCRVHSSRRLLTRSRARRLGTRATLAFVDRTCCWSERRWAETRTLTHSLINRRLLSWRARAHTRASAPRHRASSSSSSRQQVALPVVDTRRVLSSAHGALTARQPAPRASSS